MEEHVSPQVIPTHAHAPMVSRACNVKHRLTNARHNLVKTRGCVLEELVRLRVPVLRDLSELSVKPKSMNAHHNPANMARPASLSQINTLVRARRDTVV